MKKQQKNNIPALDAAILNVFRDMFIDPEERTVAINDAKQAYSYARLDNEYYNYKLKR